MTCESCSTLKLMSNAVALKLVNVGQIAAEIDGLVC